MYSYITKVFISNSPKW